jgi:hypothetical protein
MKTKPKIITICGSSKYVDIMSVIGWLLEKREMAIVMGLHLLPHWYITHCSDHLAEHEGVADQMDKLHLEKISLSDEIFVVNWNTYIGNSTKNEIAYATKNGKSIRYLTCETELYREIVEMLSNYLDGRRWEEFPR